jgi:signal transduction histidine kinase/AmiR/NasT family two-component response regulator/ABC-type amino acid transport substrate-binding protein
MNKDSGSNIRSKNKYKKIYKHIFSWVTHGIMLLLFCLFLGSSMGNCSIVSASKNTESKNPADSESGILSNDDGSDMVPGEKLVVGVPGNRCPMFYKDEKTGKIVGIGTDLMRKAAINAGYDPEFIFIKEKNLKAALDSDKYDIIMPFAGQITSTSGKESLISDSLFQTPFTLVTLQDRMPGNYTNMRIGMLKSQLGVAETVNKLYPGEKIYFYSSMDKAVKALRKEKIDGILNNSYIWSCVLQKPSYSDLYPMPTVAFSMNFCVGTLDTAKGKAIISRLNSGMADITEGQKQAVILDYSYRDLYKDDIFDMFYVYRYIIILSTIIILLLIGASILWWQQRKHYIESLEQSNRKLEDANAGLEKAGHARDIFLSSMSHDMRTPLNGIIGFLNFAIETKNMEKREEYLKKARSSADIMLDLVNDVLDLSKAVSSKMQLRPENFNALELFNEIVDSVRPMVSEHNIELTTEFSDEIPHYVYADRLRSQQLALNLLSNAVKYTPDGGKVHFAINRTKPDENGCNMVLQVKDNGIGMSKEFQEHMFEPFAQEHSSRAYEVQGTGLGLAIVKEIVELMHGKIEVCSQPDKGTEFTVRLPIIETNIDGEVIEDSTSAPTPFDIGIFRGKRVLLAEDNTINAEIATTLLRERMEMAVDTVNDGKAALDVFAASDADYYDAILMDIRMPVMNGIDATRAIRALQRWDADRVPIIAMTADSFPEDVARCQDAGMNAHVSKPINPDNLMQTMAKELQKSKKETTK